MSASASAPILRKALTVLALAAILGLAAARSGTAHEGSHAAVARDAMRPDVRLHNCWLSAAFVPTTLETLENTFRAPLVLTQTFYGPDPLAGVWGFACDRARVERRRIDQVILSFVAAPTGVTTEGATPFANNFAHALLRADTDSHALAKALRRAGVPTPRPRDGRYRHSTPEAVPSIGRLVFPGVYRIDVSASALDPTNPHDHVNSFSSVNPNGRVAAMHLFIDDAIDRFCFPSGGDCGVFVRAHRRSQVRDLFGDGSTLARAAFDHAEIESVKLALD